MRQGRFISLEGPEGCGKSTHARRLAERLERARENLLRRPGAPLPELAERAREEFRRLRAELEEVRQHLRRLEERLERAPEPRR